ncbi:cytochrome ubiquinol oxidase subunit II [Novosphingobium sp.]|uniref:cytochrome ubiquinol oxidase subunit II n=1 Tax=Novosphingobium sp. TaxID=1874826 RepID=UPI003D13EDF4
MIALPRRPAMLGLVCLLGGCAALRLGVVDHAGPVAASQWHLYLIVGAVLVFVAGPVLLLTPIMAWHYRLSNKASAYKPDWQFSWVLEALIWLPPTGIVIGLGVLLWQYTIALDPYRRLASNQPALEVQAVALDWKWLFIYPGENIATVNELDIPVGRPVHISLTSGTVMQSLMVPQLAGQIYAMPGMTTQLNLAASRAGIFHGENTQFNGKGFQAEKFNVVARAPADYANWLARVRAGKSFGQDDRAMIFARSAVARPVFMAGVPSGLFQRVLDTSAGTAR